MTVLAIVAALSLLFWLGVLLHPDRPWLPVAGHTGSRRSAESSPPLISVIIPARNEEENVGRALRSHFQSAWPRREVILIDDGSEDRTQAVARDAAGGATCPFQLIEAGTVPAGWVGKVHAMDRGFQAAQGEYILFADADIVVDPDLPAGLVAESEELALGLNSRMVLLSTVSFWERLLVPAFVYFFCLLYPFGAVARLRSRVAAAAGGCMLVRRKALEAAGGPASIRDAIIDDIALARRIKGAGFAVRLALTRKARSLRRYRRLGDFWKTVTRTAFTELRYSWLRLLATTLALILAFLGPVVALCAGLAAGCTVTAALGGGALMLTWGLYLPTVSYLGVPWLYALALPATGLLYLAMTWHSALRFAAGRRSFWKDREYRA